MDRELKQKSYLEIKIDCFCVRDINLTFETWKQIERKEKEQTHRQKQREREREKQVSTFKRKRPGKQMANEQGDRQWLGADGRAVTSHTREAPFISSQRQFYLLPIICFKTVLKRRK